VDSFWRDTWTSFKAVFGPILAGAAIVLALLGPLYAPATVVHISLIWFAVAGLLGLTVLLTAANLVMVARRYARGRLPRAVHASVPASPDGGPPRPIILVLEPSDLFGVNIFVTIYYVERLDRGRDKVFERAIGIGRVANIQQNGLIQVLVLREAPNHVELWQRIRNHDATVLPQIVIKPSIDFNEVGSEARFNE
jgi:hypothetical protein